MRKWKGQLCATIIASWDAVRDEWFITALHTLLIACIMHR